MKVISPFAMEREEEHKYAGNYFSSGNGKTIKGTNQ